jgi:hypothetical protein
MVLNMFLEPFHLEYFMNNVNVIGNGVVMIP